MQTQFYFAQVSADKPKEKKREGTSAGYDSCHFSKPFCAASHVAGWLSSSFLTRHDAYHFLSLLTLLSLSAGLDQCRSTDEWMAAIAAVLMYKSSDVQVLTGRRRGKKREKGWLSSRAPQPLFGRFIFLCFFSGTLTGEKKKREAEGGGGLKGRRSRLHQPNACSPREREDRKRSASAGTPLPTSSPSPKHTHVYPAGTK